MGVWIEALPYFTKKELACKGTGIIQLDMRFAAALPHLRLSWGGPLTPTSVCRTPERNESEDGHPRSLHLTENPVHPTNGTMAADLYWGDWPAAKRLRLARLAYKLGWAVGLHRTFIHVDRRKDIGLQQRVFLYGAWDKAFNAEDVY